MVGMVLLAFVILGFSFFQSWMFLEVLLLGAGFAVVWVFLQLGSGGAVFNSLVISYDWLSLMLIALTFFISALMISSSYSSVKFSNKGFQNFLFLIILMMFSLFMSFLSSKLIMFYVFFEISLIPIFLMIMGWGNQPERLQAGLYMLFYTLFGSLPLLVAVLMNVKVFEFLWVTDSFSDKTLFSFVVMFFFIFAFLVKLPMFSVHLWLPKAHVEAPVAGSMMLAGVLLKLGGYGLWRVSYFLGHLVNQSSWVLAMMGLAGGTLVSFICMIQVDMKSLVAYSSVVHMGLGLGGLAVLTLSGYEGMYCMMLGHGLVSSLMFFLVGVFYDRLHSRSLMLSKGLMVMFPFFTLFWFIACIYNISAPPSISLLGEVFLTLGLVQWSTYCAGWLMLMNFMGMVFTFYLYAQSQQGKFVKSMSILWPINLREVMVSVFHAFSVTSFVLFFWLF